MTLNATAIRSHARDGANPALTAALAVAGIAVATLAGANAMPAVAVTDVTNAQALAYVHKRLKRLGVDRALARAGAREGDLVRIGGLTFEFEPD